MTGEDKSFDTPSLNGQVGLIYEPVVLRRLIERVEADARKDIDSSARIIISIDPPLAFPLELETRRIYLIVAALLQNALVHAEAKTIEIHAEMPETGRIRISVRDDGLGFSEEQLKQYNDPSVPLKMNSLSTGVQQVRRLVADLNGNVTFSQMPNGGGQIVLEIDGEPAVRPTRVQRRAIDFSNTSVLLVDDDRVMIDCTARVLGDLGAEVMSSTDPEQAVSLVKKHKPTFVICDHFMPDMHGDVWIKAAREVGYSGPIVGLTGATFNLYEHPMLDAGAAVVIEKPINPLALRNALDNSEELFS